MTFKQKINIFKKHGFKQTIKAVANEKQNTYMFVGYKFLLDGLIADFEKMLIQTQKRNKPGITQCLEHCIMLKTKHFTKDTPKEDTEDK
jgi:hypothetical protein